MKHNIMKFDKTITTWDEAIPLGNGALGCLIWGKSDALRLSIDRCDIWDCSDPPSVGGDYTYKFICDMAHSGNVERIREVFNYPYQKKAAPTKLPAGKIIVNMGVEENVVSLLDMEKAYAAITAGDVGLESFQDASDTKVGFLKINTTECSFAIENPDYGIIGEPEDDEVSANSLKKLKYETALKLNENVAGNVFKGFAQKISDVNTYGLFLMEKRIDGVTYAVYTVEKGSNADEVIAIAKDKLAHALEFGYETVLEGHIAWWKDFWSKSHIELCEDEFFEKNWYITNYLLGSCSRKGYYPMPLQGVWTADDGLIPPWKGDYHHDLNTEMSYYSYLKANHLEEGESYIDYIFSLEDVARKFAKNFYDIDDGLCIPGCMDLDGNALGGWPMYALSPTNCAWLCRGLGDYYDYTGDVEYLKSRAYPFIKEYTKFLLCLLKENDEGKLVLPISSSPEIHDDNIEAYLTPNSTYDLTLMMRLFSDMKNYAEILGYDEDVKQWSEVLEKLDSIPVDTDGTIMLSRDARLLESHRHQSHLMAIHPLKLIKYDTKESKRIIDASIADNLKLGHYLYVGYSFPWRAEFCAIQHNGDAAHEALDTFWRYYCLPNGFHCNGDYKDKLGCFWTYRPFTLEGNMCAADALQEMLLQDINGDIVIAPAIPSIWKNYSFKLRSANGAIVTYTNKDGKATVHLEAWRDIDNTRVFVDEKQIALVKLGKGQTQTIEV